MTVLAFGGDWAGFRGPNQNGSADETHLPAVLSIPQNLSWSVALPGESSATPIVSKGRIFLSSTQKGGKDLLALCLDAASGKILWQKTLAVAAQNPPRNTMTSSSPAADGRRVVFLYTDGTCTALDYDGGVLWSKNLSEKFGPFSNKFGYSSSPLIDDGRVYIPLIRRETPWSPMTSDKPLDSYLIALDIQTGDVLFASVRKTRAKDETKDSYVTPVLAELNGQKQILLSGGNCLTGHSPADGRTLWEFEYDQSDGTRGRAVSSPVCDGTLVYYTVPRGAFTIAVRPDKPGRLGPECRRWLFDQTGPDCANPLLYKGLLYLIDDSGEKTMYCINPGDGQLIWKDKLPAEGPIFASPTAADDKIYILDESGKVMVVAAGGRKMNLLSTLKLGGKPAYSTIAIANGCLFVRTAEKLYCFREGK
jgi:outer membrane protein assembly factor BamB